MFAVLVTGSTLAFAQEQRVKEPGKVTFKPYWFIQAQVGAAHTVKLNSQILFLLQLLLILTINLLLHSVHVLV